jgi:Mg2+-importing ATPase
VQSIASPVLIFTTGVIMLTAAVLPYLPFAAHYLHLAPLPASFWGWMVLFLLGYSILTHWTKMWFIRRYGIE